MHHSVIVQCRFVIILAILIHSQLFLVIASLAINEKESRWPRIVSGKIAMKNEFPFIVSIGVKFSTSVVCGGTIYNERTIITAAHCVVDEKDSPFSILHLVFSPVTKYVVKSPRKLIVVAGEHYVDRLEGSEQFRNVSKIIVHPNYSGHREAYDIALLLLAKPLKFNEYVKPIELASRGYVAIGFGTIVGWGITGWNGKDSAVLRKGRVPILPELVCKLSFDDFRIFSNICAGGTNQDTCNGDSGGPLLCGDPPVLCGVTSYGSGCGRLLRPGAYSKVSYFYDWIIGHAFKFESTTSAAVTVTQSIPVSLNVTS